MIARHGPGSAPSYPRARSARRYFRAMANNGFDARGSGAVHTALVLTTIKRGTSSVRTSRTCLSRNWNRDSGTAFPRAMWVLAPKGNFAACRRMRCSIGAAYRRRRAIWPDSSASSDGSGPRRAAVDTITFRPVPDRRRQTDMPAHLDRRARSRAHHPAGLRLWAIDERTCLELLDTLVLARFLRRGARGR